MLEDTTRVNLLYDFYGNLLTEKQRECLEFYYQHDLSLAEIADHSNISRQGVHDLLKRSVKTLEKAEIRLGMVARFATQDKDLRRLREIIAHDQLGSQEREEALTIVDRLLD